MKFILAAATAVLALTTPAFAEGDAAKGEKDFKKCKTCHMIVSPEGETIQKGGKTGPNLYGVVGRTAGTFDGFKYGKALKAAADQGLVWDEEQLTAFVTDPKKYLGTTVGDKKTKMTFKMKKGAENVVAYLASVGPAPEPESDTESAEDTAVTE